MGDAGAVLVEELVLGRLRVRVAALPERLDEGVAELLAGELEERPPLAFGGDIDRLLLEEGAVPGGELRLRGNGERERGAEDQRSPGGATVRGAPAS